MTFLSRTSPLLLIAAMYLVSVSFAQAVDVWTVGINNTRQGWNKFETVLTPANVPNLKKIREFAVDEKIDVSPLVVGDKLYVFTMTNTAYVFCHSAHQVANTMRFIKAGVQLLVMRKYLVFLIVFNMTAHYYNGLAHEEHKKSPDKCKDQNNNT